MTVRWLRPLMLATMTFVALLTLVATIPSADAQVFRPRGKTAATAKASSKKSPPPKPAASVSKSPTRSPGPTVRRVGATKPSKKSRATGKARHDDDVTVHDDDDDDVKIIDDN